MSELVKVEDPEVFGRLRLALLKFAQTADSALSNADSEIAGTHSWLETEQRDYWQSQLRKRAEALARATDALRQKKLYKDFTGRHRDAPEEEKVVAKCTAALEQAQQKIEAVKRWLPRLEKASEGYRGGVSRLANTLSNDIPRATAFLDHLAISIEQYVQIEPPALATPDSPAPLPAEPSMARAAGSPAPTPPPPPAPHNETAKPEAPNVPH